MPWIIAATTAIFCRIVQFLYYSDVDQIMLKSLLVSVFFEKKTLQKYVDMFLACPKSKVTIKLKFYYSNLKNAVETAKIAVDSCYVLRQFLTSLPSIDFREIRGLVRRVDSYPSDNLKLIRRKPDFPEISYLYQSLRQLLLGNCKLLL